MKIQYRMDILTKVPTCALVEDYQMLANAIHDEDWDAVRTVLECLAETIERHTQVPSDLDIKPSPSSLVAMGCTQGIIGDDDGRDFLCALNRPISEALNGGVVQCPDNCPHRETCAPGKGKPVLAAGQPANEEDLVALLESMPDSATSAEAKELAAYIRGRDENASKYSLNEVTVWACRYCRENGSTGTKLSDLFSGLDLKQAMRLLNEEAE